MDMADVLLVDDDGSVLLTLAIALRRQGHSVTVAGDAIQAMTHLHKIRFDFLISDVRMPGVSGLELAARARSLSNPPRVILTSAYPFVEDRHSVSEAFLQKPIDVHLLSAYLNSQRPGGSGSLPVSSAATGEVQEDVPGAEPRSQSFATHTAEEGTSSSRKEAERAQPQRSSRQILHRATRAHA
jgi:CheY-like chemotaxis protein